MRKMLFKIPAEELDIDYYLDINTGKVYRESINKQFKKKYIEIKPIKYSEGCDYLIYLKAYNGNRYSYTYAKFIAYWYEYFKYGKIDKVFNKDFRIPVFKDGNKYNTSLDNIVLGDLYYKEYYKQQDRFSELIENRVCIIDDSYSVNDARKDGLIPVRTLTSNDELFMDRFENDRYSIDTNGVVFDNESCRFLVNNISSCGYVSCSFKDMISDYYNSNNVIRLLAIAFLGLEHNDSSKIASFKDSSVPRDTIDLDNIVIKNRSTVVKDYHKRHPEHYDKYLRYANKTNRIPVSVNGNKFRSISDAAKYIIDIEKTSLGKERKLTTVRTLVSLRVKGKIKKPMYNKYTITSQ